MHHRFDDESTTLDDSYTNPYGQHVDVPPATNKPRKTERRTPTRPTTHTVCTSVRIHDRTWMLGSDMSTSPRLLNRLSTHRGSLNSPPGPQHTTTPTPAKTTSSQHSVEQRGSDRDADCQAGIETNQPKTEDSDEGRATVTVKQRGEMHTHRRLHHHRRHHWSSQRAGCLPLPPSSRSPPWTMPPSAGRQLLHWAPPPQQWVR